MKRIVTGLFLTLAMEGVLLGQPAPVDESVVHMATAWSETGAKAGTEITLAVVLDIKPGYHIGGNLTTPPFLPTFIELAGAPPFVVSSTAIFPEPHQFNFGIGDEKQTIKVFSDRAVVYLPMKIGDSAAPGHHELKIRIGFQACNDKICKPPAESTLPVELNVVPPQAAIQKINGSLFKDLDALRDRLNIPFFGFDFVIAPSKFWLLLLVAAFGGFLLNFTPCVLPLIPIKILSLSKTAGDRRRCFFLGLILSFGVVAFWIGLAAAISTITGFNTTNKLFQYPIFTITVGLTICIMAVGMTGLFSIRLPAWAYAANPSQGSALGSFLFGIMTAVLSTPCTAPFMGAAAAWSTTQTPSITILTFSAIGFGMALPYLLLSTFPFLISCVPRAGPASELVKQIMGLFMLAAGAYFLGTGLAGMWARPPDPPAHSYWWIVAGLIALAATWLCWRTFQITTRFVARAVSTAAAFLILLCALAIGVRFTRTSPIHWVYFTPDRFDAAQKQNKIVVLEFTAGWCLNCRALEETVLHDARVIALMNSSNVVPIKVDLTGNNPVGNAKLIEVGRRAIPYLVIYSPNHNQIFASDAYTVEQVLNALSPRGF